MSYRAEKLAEYIHELVLAEINRANVSDSALTRIDRIDRAKDNLLEELKTLVRMAERGEAVAITHTRLK